MNLERGNHSFIHSFGDTGFLPQIREETGLAVLPRLSCSQVWPRYSPARNCHLLHFSPGLVHPSLGSLASPSQEGTTRGQPSADTWSAPGTAAHTAPGSTRSSRLGPRGAATRLTPPVFFFFCHPDPFIVIKNTRYLNAMVNI